MPCSDGREFEDRQREREALDAATRAACELGKVLRSCGKWFDVTAETKAWYTDHAERDVRRGRKVIQPKYS